MKRGTVDRFQLAREISAVPYVINSGYRCPDHNREVGGTKTSSHQAGYAADIQCNMYSRRWKILDGLVKAGFTRIGIGKSFIHADDDPNKTPGVIWVY